MNCQRIQSNPLLKCLTISTHTQRQLSEISKTIHEQKQVQQTNPKGKNILSKAQNSIERLKQ